MASFAKSLLSRASVSNGSVLRPSARTFSSLSKRSQLNVPDSKAPGYGNRPHAITLFPGDYSDQFDPWNDEDEDDFEGDKRGSFDDAEETRAFKEALLKQTEIETANRERWRKNAEPPVYVSKIDEFGRSHGKGGRKAATATCIIQPGFGEVVVNSIDFVDYFERYTDREKILEPMCVTETCGLFDLQIHVRGGGLTGQAGAARLAVANALTAYNPDLYRTVLKRKEMLTRDARKVERKKIGRVKARKSPQWVRR